VPLDLPAIRKSAQKTGRLVVVDESFPTCSMASEIITSVVEDAESMSALKTAPIRVTTLAAPIPFSAVLEDHVLPGEDRIRSAVLAAVGR
jgi:pyruvate/2-oxoglutarate/acetoin dehydrogenase E1 component